MDDVHYDYKIDAVCVANVFYALKDYRKFLLGNHPDLCQNHFIKAITVGGKTKFTFDWQSIYAIASRYKYLNNFINEQETRRTN